MRPYLPVTGFGTRPMSKDDEYQRNAAEALKWADEAKSDYQRAAWLRVAQKWLSLSCSGRTPTALERFDDQVAQQSTGQENSKERH